MLFLKSLYHASQIQGEISQTGMYDYATISTTHAGRFTSDPLFHAAEKLEARILRRRSNRRRVVHCVDLGSHPRHCSLNHTNSSGDAYDVSPVLYNTFSTFVFKYCNKNYLLINSISCFSLVRFSNRLHAVSYSTHSLLADRLFT